MQEMSENTALIRQLQSGTIQRDDKDRDDSSALITLFDTEESPDGQTIDCAIYSEQLMAQFEVMQLSPPTSALSSGESVDPFADIASIPSSHTSPISTIPQGDHDSEPKIVSDGIAQLDNIATSDDDLLRSYSIISTSRDGNIGKPLSTISLPTMPALQKFRILIIGQTGVGKSTLCSKILGINEDAVMFLMSVLRWYRTNIIRLASVVEELEHP